ncbi:MAG: hypothetical protein MSC31_05795 [Solirubrobacteraceae bacterium MAG38_C4-C5]|nr:hypothetical protein [Candidatus Siliceabacter maunaloa]
MENDDRILARLDGHMAEGNQIMRENRRAFEDLRQFLGEMTEVLQALVGQVSQNSAAVGEHREEAREQWQELREEAREQWQEMRAERRESHEQWRQAREEQEKLREEFYKEARALREAFREESRMQRAALIAILDQLRGEGPGTAPAT